MIQLVCQAFFFSFFFFSLFFVTDNYSVKQFFISLLQSQCLFQGNCGIDTRTRRFCPACRIHKCFAIGMKSDMILGEQPFII